MLPDYIKLKEVKPVLSDYIREAHLMLKKDDVPDDKVVHDVRVLMKKSRAAIQLLRSQLDQDSFNREYQSFRNVGRIMSSWREFAVHRKILKYFRKKYPDVFVQMKDSEIPEILLKKQDPVPEMRVAITKGTEEILDLLNKAYYRLRFYTLNNLDPRTALNELDQTFNKSAESYLTSRNNLKPSSLHDFRKKSKDFLYQLYFFRPVNNQSVKTLEKQLDIMTRNLGKFNDLEILIDTLGYKRNNNDNSPAFHELIILIREEQDKYLSKAWPIGYKIFCPGRNLINVLGFKLLVF